MNGMTKYKQQQQQQHHIETFRKIRPTIILYVCLK